MKEFTKMVEILAVEASEMSDVHAQKHSIFCSLIVIILKNMKWWRTTSVATKTRYHGAGGALSRTWIFLLIFLLYCELLTHMCLSRSSLISLSLLDFRVGSSLFGILFMKPFFFVNLYFYEYV